MECSFCYNTLRDEEYGGRSFIMTIDEMKQRKIELGLSNEMIAAESGVPLSTVQKIFCGITKAPRKATIDALQAVLEDGSRPYQPVPQAGAVREKALAYGVTGTIPGQPEDKRQGEYTLEDYYAIPDDRRVELIDGVIYDMATPIIRHQIIISEMYVQLSRCKKVREGECTVIASPSDVQLNKDNRTMLRPDLYVVCGKVNMDAASFFGAPDMVVEVLLPSSRSHDMLLKLNKYHDAGVKEYWIIDPQYRKILVYDLTDESLYPDEYDFDSVVPVRLSEGSCSVDFKEISRKVFTD